MDVISRGYYSYLIGKIIDTMDIKPGHLILNLGSGTGRNTCFIAQKIVYTKYCGDEVELKDEKYLITSRSNIITMTK